MQLTIPRVLLMAALVAFFLPAVGTAQPGFCSDSYCANVPADLPCLCPHCPWVLVECSLRFTCAFEEGSFGPGLMSSLPAELSQAFSDISSEADGAEPEERESTLGRDEEPQNADATRSPQALEEKARLP